LVCLDHDLARFVVELAGGIVPPFRYPVFGDRVPLADQRGDLLAGLGQRRDRAVQGMRCLACAFRVDQHVVAVDVKAEQELFGRRRLPRLGYQAAPALPKNVMLQ